MKNRKQPMTDEERLRAIGGCLNHSISSGLNASLSPGDCLVLLRALRGSRDWIRFVVNAANRLIEDVLKD